MAEVLTPQQKVAVKNRGGKLLVCAAAGSGKTKVLVDRLIDYILDPISPANLDDFLVITYTKAAAAELRGKIAAKLAEHMANFPENKHLQRQMQHLFLAKISTVHAFCADILKEYAYLLDIPADFRVADENECLQLRIMCMEKVLDEAYATLSEDSDFYAFVETQGLGRDDRLVPELLFRVYDSARCHLNPQKWLDGCLEHACVENVTDAAQTIWGAYLMQDLCSYLDLQIEALESCIQQASSAEGMEKPMENLSETVAQLKKLRGAQTWDAIVCEKEIDYGRLTFSKKCSNLDLAERIKAVRNACKKGLDKKLRNFTDSSSDVLSDLHDTLAALRGMVSLVRRFEATFTAAKRNRHVLDFSDLEQHMLDLLLGKDRNRRTAVCEELSERFREILVDEYQDSNAVQDAIFSALSDKRNNCFMVGDVKQSIYQFRLADPGIFLQKHSSFLSAEAAEDGQGRKVQLTKNFRSGGAVLSAVNDVFRCCMTPKVGGVVYDDTEALVEGKTHIPLGEPEVEFWAIDVQQTTYVEEAAFVARRITQLLDGSHFIREGEQLRKIRPEDIVILLRSPGSAAGYFVSALSQAGIPTVTGGVDDLLQSEEIVALRSLLQTISNPRQDIPLLATLCSPIFGFTADDLAGIRTINRKCSIYDALIKSESGKAKSFLQTLDSLRKTARNKPLSELMAFVFNTTRIDSLYGAMADGSLRKERLLQFYQFACGFSMDGHGNLEQFLEYLTAMEGKGLVSQQEKSSPGAVTIMSIHKSKGLEFPVVIVSNLSREFNRESVRAQVLCDQELGIGLSAVDTHNRLRYPTIAKRAIAVKTVSDSLSEEMRVLYVALTRPKDRLIMTYAVKKMEADISVAVNCMDIGSSVLPVMDAVCPGDWVMMAALQRTEAGQLFALGGYPSHTASSQYPWHIQVVTGDLQQEPLASIDTPASGIPIEDISKIRSGLAYRYQHTVATQLPSKQTATQRKGREKDVQISENTVQTVNSFHFRKPDFAVSKLNAADHGTAMHVALQYLHFDDCATTDAVYGQLDKMVTRNLISEQHRDMVDCGKIVRFLKTPIGQKLCNSHTVLREFQFSILEDASQYAPELESEKVLLQGVVDCAVLEEDGITIIDFKTDDVSLDNLEQRGQLYRPQVMAYVNAMERIYELPVKEALLYFFGPEQFLKL